MQEILTFIAVGMAAFFLMKKGYDLYFSKKSKCEGCAIHQIRATQHVRK
jgi:hypothetical protein